MNVSIHFPEEIEAAIHRETAAAGIDVETFVRAAVTEKLEEEKSSRPARRVSHEEFQKKLRKIIDAHPRSTGHVDDSRESIYAGRGE